MTKGEEERKRLMAVKQGEAGVPLGQISKAIGVGRARVTRWLTEAGLEPVMLRKKSTTGHSTISNTPLALEIDRNVQRRIEKQDAAAIKQGRRAKKA